MCVDGTNCSTDQEFQINLSNTENPLVSPADLDPFIIEITSPSGNAIFKSPAVLSATPELEVGPLISLTISHQNTVYIKESTEYYYEFETSSDIPAGGKIILFFPNERIYEDSTSTLTCKLGDAQ